MTRIFIALCLGIASQATFGSTREIRHLEIESPRKNIAFQEFEARWFATEEMWSRFWAENSRDSEPIAPTVKVDWTQEAVLGIIWKSEDTIVRLPSFAGSTLIPTAIPEDRPSLELHYFLTTPCFGIITDVSPSQFLVFRHRDVWFQDVEIKTEEARASNCWDLPEDTHPENENEPEPATESLKKSDHSVD